MWQNLSRTSYDERMPKKQNEAERKFKNVTWPHSSADRHMTLRRWRGVASTYRSRTCTVQVFTGMSSAVGVCHHSVNAFCDWHFAPRTVCHSFRIIESVTCAGLDSDIPP